MTSQTMTSEEVFKLYAVATYIQSLTEVERESRRTDSVGALDLLAEAEVFARRAIGEALDLMAEAEPLARQVIGIEACDGHRA